MGHLKQLYSLYEKELRLLHNPSCTRCDAKTKYPLAAWHVGSEFDRAEHRVLFVGKPHRGTPGKCRRSKIIDPSELVASELAESSWPYWSYTREIADTIHGTANGWDRIALTNLVKCTNVDSDDSSQDTTSLSMVQSCVAELGVIAAEIESLKPTEVVFYTANFFPEAMEFLKIAGSAAWTDVRHTSYRCGAKRLPWWERTIEVPWRSPLRVLITGHPERMLRESYVERIAGWIEGST